MQKDIQTSDSADYDHKLLQFIQCFNSLTVQRLNKLCVWLRVCVWLCMCVFGLIRASLGWLSVMSRSPVSRICLCAVAMVTAASPVQAVMGRDRLLGGCYLELHVTVTAARDWIIWITATQNQLLHLTSDACVTSEVIKPSGSSVIC